MKKVLSIVITAILIIAMAACGEADKFPETHRANGNYGGVVTVIEGAHGFDNDFRYYSRLIKTYEELKDFLKKPELISAGREFKNQVKRYDGNFFAEKYLVFIADWQGSGSTRLTVDSIETEQNTVNISINSKTPQIGTADMKLWIFLIEIGADSKLDTINYKVTTK